MKRATSGGWKRVGVLGLGVMCALAGAVRGQHVPGAQGSLDAVKVLPTSQPATLPGGQPTLDQAGGAAEPETPFMPGHPKGMETVRTGALRVVVSQGTKDGPAIGKDAVTVTLLSLGKVLKTYKTELGENGVVEVRDLPLEVGFQPVVTVMHAGVEQQLVGPPMFKYQPAIELEMKVYEVTEVKPAWTIGIRQVEMAPVAVEGGVGLRVTEMFGGNNPTDRAWAGEVVGEGGEKQTMRVELPEGATNVQFGPGMLEADAKVVKGAIVRGKTMLPGPTEYWFAYVLPVKDGKASLSFTAPADTTLFAAYVPGDSKVEKAEGVEVGKAGGVHGDVGRQLLKAKGLKAGAVARVELSGITAPLPPATQKAATINNGGMHPVAPGAPGSGTTTESK